MNASAQHTPGPWEWWTSNSHKRLSAGGRDGSVLYAFNARDGFPCISVSDADARLIAAAPDLLEAANEVSEWEAKYPADRVYGHMEIVRIAKEMTAIVEKARAAIAKATGAAS